MEKDTETEVETKEEKNESLEGVTIPEEFQQEVYELVKKLDTTSKCSYLNDCVYKRRDELMKMEEKKKGKKPTEFSTAEMPTD